MNRARGLAVPATLAALLALAQGSSDAHGAQDPHGAAPQRTIHIYRCTDAGGHVTLQNDTPCPKGARQEMQVVDVPPPMPAYVPREERMPDVVAAERADETAAIAAAVRPPAAARPGPPPALYACRTWDAVEFLTEEATPAERCRPLQVVGVDGVARADAAACEKVVDQCAAVPADGLCQAWRRRVDEAEFRWKFAGARQDNARRREYELLKATLAASDCQKP
jgi:hypothetical protein